VLIFALAHAVLLFQSIRTRASGTINLTLRAGVAGDSIFVLFCLSAFSSLVTTGSMVLGANLNSSSDLGKSATIIHVSSVFMFLLFVTFVYSVCVSWVTFGCVSLLLDDRFSASRSERKDAGAAAGS